MMSIEQIQTAILQLPEIELTHFRQWYEEWEASLWDKQIEQDIKGGNLDKLAQEALRELDAQQCTEL